VVEMPGDELIEAMARRIHDNFLQTRRGVEAETHPALRAWDELSEPLRAQNRDQARDNLVKLHKVGLRVVPADQAGDARVELDDSYVDRLAHLEHDRWARQKQRQGYRHGEERVDDGPDLRHPDLKAWDELSEDVKDKDREPVRKIAEVLAAAGLATVPDEPTST
jgi:hypothetical protein